MQDDDPPFYLISVTINHDFAYENKSNGGMVQWVKQRRCCVANQA